MNKTEINHIANQLHDCDQNNYFQLRRWAHDYPYFQQLHLMIAVLASKFNESNQKTALHTSALYCGDRTVLKNWIKQPTPVTPKTITVEPLKTEQVTPASEIEQPKTTDFSQTETPNNADTALEESTKNIEQLYDEIKRNLAQLRQNKESGIAKFQDVVNKVEQIEAKNSEKLPQELIENSNILDQDNVNINTDAQDQGTIIDQFMSSKQKMSFKPEDISKELDQLKDLAAPSIVMDENLVSENLAKILLNQGRVSKAIDIYKKLIWKIPQKKAYFASQIEKIKKKKY